MTDNRTTELLPCPMCGGEARLVNDYGSEKGMSYQIWHECTGHEGRSGGYGQGVKPFFETPWYATDAEAIAAWNTRAYLNPDGLPVGLTISDDGNLLNWRGENYVKQGTLTAEQVREAIFNGSSYASYDGAKYYADGIGMQSIADELNATLGSGTCEWQLEHSGTLYDKWRCSKCGYLFVESRTDQGIKEDFEPNFCPNCGVKVVAIKL